MNNNKKNITKEDPQEQVIEKAIRTGGFTFPETIEEVKEFEQIFGTTDIVLPERLKELDFLHNEEQATSLNKHSIALSGNFAMAARDGSSDLPSEIKKKIIKDIKLSESKKKKK